MGLTLGEFRKHWARAEYLCLLSWVPKVTPVPAPYLADQGPEKLPEKGEGLEVTQLREELQAPWGFQLSQTENDRDMAS